MISSQRASTGGLSGGGGQLYLPHLPTGFSSQPGTSQPTPRAPGFLLLCPHGPKQSVTQKCSKTNGNYQVMVEAGKVS